MRGAHPFLNNAVRWVLDYIMWCPIPTHPARGPPASLPQVRAHVGPRGDVVVSWAPRARHTARARRSSAAVR